MHIFLQFLLLITMQIWEMRTLFFPCSERYYSCIPLWRRGGNIHPAMILTLMTNWLSVNSLYQHQMTPDQKGFPWAPCVKVHLSQTSSFKMCFSSIYLIVGWDLVAFVYCVSIVPTTVCGSQQDSGYACWINESVISGSKLCLVDLTG